MPIRLDDGVAVFQKMRTFVPGQANLNPPKRLMRLRKLINSKEAPNICVVRGEGIGDVLMTTPTVRALKKAFSEVTLTFATNTRYLDGSLSKVLQYNPDIDHVIDRDRLDESNFDMVVNLHCPALKHEKKENPPVNRVDLFAQHTGVELLNKQIRYFMQDEEDKWGKDFLFRSGVKLTDKTIFVNIFTTATKRNLDSQVFKEALMTLGRMGFKLIVARHSSDAATNIMWEQIPNVIILKDADIRNLVGVMANCNLILCPDSAIMHLAGALSIPMVAIFTYTDPNARVNYYENVSVIWEGRKLNCSPCWSSPCYMNLTCFKMITSDMIVNECMARLKSSNQLTGFVALDNEMIMTEVL